MINRFSSEPPDDLGFLEKYICELELRKETLEEILSRPPFDFEHGSLPKTVFFYAGHGPSSITRLELLTDFEDACYKLFKTRGTKKDITDLINAERAIAEEYQDQDNALHHKRIIEAIRTKSLEKRDFAELCIGLEACAYLIDNLLYDEGEEKRYLGYSKGFAEMLRKNHSDELILDDLENLGRVYLALAESEVIEKDEIENKRYAIYSIKYLGQAIKLDSERESLYDYGRALEVCAEQTENPQKEKEFLELALTVFKKYSQRKDPFDSKERVIEIEERLRTF